MDAERFDHLVRALATDVTRRGLARVLAATPLGAGLLAALGGEEAADARKRRRVSADNHQHEHRRRKHRNRRGKKKQQCRPKSRAITCDGRCGAVKNNCRKSVDCGPCLCEPACAACTICDEATGACVPDPEQLGLDCGQPGQICLDEGVCACAAGTCQNPAPICLDGACVPCSGSRPCPDGGCCDGGSCTGNGAPCDDGDRCTTGDSCQDGTCRGTPVPCTTPSECQALPGACDPATGDCQYPARPDGTRCGNQCEEACTAGVCGPGVPVTCQATVCQVAGVCNPATGTCSPPTNRPQGTDCSSAVPCGRCDGAGTCLGCVGTDCCGTDGLCHGDGESCRPGMSGFCCNGECTCFNGGFCRISPEGATCCCSDSAQVCVGAGAGNCEFPP